MAWLLKNALQYENHITVVLYNDEELNPETKEYIERSETWTHDPKDEHLPGKLRTSEQFIEMVKKEIVILLNHLNTPFIPETRNSIDISEIIRPSPDKMIYKI